MTRGAAPGRAREAGIILANVLVALALGAALVMLMLTSQDGAIDRARRAAAAAQAEALALGAETSVLVALRRDMTEAPEADSLSEPWALAAQEEVELETGRFAVTIHDAQGRLDLNGLAGGAVVQVEGLERLVAMLDLPPEVVGLVAAALRDRPLDRLEQVEGLDDETRSRLDPYVSFLPRLPEPSEPASVNLNAADPLLMGALLGNQVAAGRLADLRERNGELTREDLLGLGLLPTAAVGFTSDVWDVTALAEVDGVEVMLTSRLVRLRGPDSAEVVVASRRFGRAVGPSIPTLPGPS